MATLNKIVVNNKIVSMRHDVRRAKLHTISQLLKEARKLNIKRGTDAEKNKNKKKKERLLEAIKVTKGLGDDEVSSFMLCNDKDPLIILNDPHSDIRLKALAKISMHKAIKASLYDFKMNYPDFRDEITKHLFPDPSKRNAMKKHRLKSNNNKLSPNKLHENLNKVSSVASDDITSEENLEIQQPINKLNKPVKNEKRVVDPFFVSPDNSGYMTVVTNEKQVEPFSKPDNEKFKNKFSFKRNSVQNVENTNSYGNRSNHSDEKVNSSINFNSVRKPYKGGTWQNKQTFSEHDKKEKLHPSWEAKKKLTSGYNEFKGKKTVFGDEKFENKCSFNRNSVQNVEDTNSYGNRSNHCDEKVNSSNNFNSVRKPYKGGTWQNKQTFSEHDKKEKLHPSWEAKKKLTSGYNEFKGKKTVFDDD